MNMKRRLDGLEQALNVSGIGMLLDILDDKEKLASARIDPKLAAALNELED